MGKVLRPQAQPLQRLFFLFLVLGVACALVLSNGGTRAEAAPAVQPRSALGVGVTMSTLGVPFLSAALHADDVTLGIEAVEAEHSLLDTKARTRIILALARYRLPIAWHDWRPAADIGLVSVSAHTGGVQVGATGFTVGAGVERPLSADGFWYLRGEARYVRLLNRSHWMAGIGVEWRLPLPGLGAAGSVGRGPGGDGAGVTVAADAVSASGSITSVSLPVSVSGRWELYADPKRRTAWVFLEGTVNGESGSYGFSDATEVYFDGRTLSATFVERTTHEGMDVTGTVYVTASPTGFSLSVSARRADGLSASASISGTTSSFEIIGPGHAE